MRFFTILLMATLGVAGCASHTVLNLDANEENASIYLNDDFLGQTPVLKLKTKDKKVNTLKFVKEGFLDVEKVYYSGQKKLTYTAELIPKVHFEEVIINTSPNGSAVYLDEEYLGTTPLEADINDLFQKAHTIRLQKKGYESQLVRLKYKGRSYKDDNYLDQIFLDLNVSLTIEENKQLLQSNSSLGSSVNVNVGAGGSLSGLDAAAERADRAAAAERADRLSSERSSAERADRAAAERADRASAERASAERADRADRAERAERAERSIVNEYKKLQVR